MPIFADWHLLFTYNSNIKQQDTSPLVLKFIEDYLREYFTGNF